MKLPKVPYPSHIWVAHCGHVVSQRLGKSIPGNSGHIPTRRHPGIWQCHSSTLPHYSGPGCARRRKRLPWRTCYSYRYTMVHASKGKTEILGKRSPAMKRCAILIFASVLSLSVRAGAQGAEKIHELKSSPSTVHRGFYDATLKPVLT